MRLLAALLLCVALPAQFATSVERHGHRWTFAQPAQVGTFANGDPFVVGPVTITSIFPAPGLVGGAQGNGSVINPNFADGDQGWDAGGQLPYDPSEDASRLLPNLVLQPGDSLVSCKSGTGFSQIESAAVLTCVASRPVRTCFRPPYSGPNKPTALYPTTLMRPENLVRCCAPAMAADLPALTARFEHLWLDGVSGWAGEYLHPEAYMPPYYRDFSTVAADMLFALAADVDVGQKLGGAVAFCQWGIDCAWNARNGLFGDGGGHGSGRKVPIVFAGLLGIDDCQLPNSWSPRDHRDTWTEDGQTFFVDQAQVDRGVGYSVAMIGTPEWGNFHYQWVTGKPASADDPSWDANPYRQCCHSNAWHGTALVMRAMGGLRSWGWPAYFAYHDRYVQTEFGRNDAAWIKGWKVVDGAPVHFDEYVRLRKSDLRGITTIGLPEVGSPSLRATIPPHQGQPWTVHIDAGEAGVRVGVLTRSRETLVRPSRNWGPFEVRGLVFVALEAFQASVVFTTEADGKAVVTIPPSSDVAGTTYTLQAVVLREPGVSLWATNAAEVAILPPLPATVR